MWKIKLRRFWGHLTCSHPEDTLKHYSRGVGLQTFYITECTKCGKYWVK